MNPDTTLTDLMEQYRAARTAVCQAAPMVRSLGDVCRYCAGRWQRWESNKYDGHVQCFVTPVFKRQLARAIQKTPELSYDKLAAVLGVTVSGLRAWRQAGLAGQPQGDDR